MTAASLHIDKLEDILNSLGFKVKEMKVCLGSDTLNLRKVLNFVLMKEQVIIRYPGQDYYVSKKGVVEVFDNKEVEQVRSEEFPKIKREEIANAVIAELEQKYSLDKKGVRIVSQAMYNILTRQLKGGEKTAGEKNVEEKTEQV